MTQLRHQSYQNSDKEERATIAQTKAERYADPLIRKPSGIKRDTMIKHQCDDVVKRLMFQGLLILIECGDVDVYINHFIDLIDS